MKRRKARKASKLFSTGQLNRLVDDLLHPLFQESKSFIWIDGALHTLIEANPKLSVEKFVKYSVPQLLKENRKKKPKRERCSQAIT